MSDVVITVRGEHETRIAPERATARLVVTADGPARGAIVERVAALAQPVRDDLAARKDAGSIAAWSSQRASVWSERPWNAEGRQLALVHHGSVELTATFTDVAELSWWVDDVASRDGVQVVGIDWALAPQTRADLERTVAAEAVRVAVARATAYAQAIGRESVTVLEVADAGLLQHDHGAPSPAPIAMRAAAFSAGETGPTLSFHPDDLVVSAAVEARFVAR